MRGCWGSQCAITLIIIPAAGNDAHSNPRPRSQWNCLFVQLFIAALS